MDCYCQTVVGIFGPSTPTSNHTIHVLVKQYLLLHWRTALSPQRLVSPLRRGVRLIVHTTHVMKRIGPDSCLYVFVLSPLDNSIYFAMDVANYKYLHLF